VKYELGVAVSDENRCFGFAMMMVADTVFGATWVTHPDLLRADRCAADRGKPLHARCLRGPGAQI